MIKKLKLKHSLSFLILLLSISSIKVNAQFTSGTTGLLHMPSAEMQKDATVMVGGNLLNSHNIPNHSWWGDYNTFNYFINITFFKRIEVSYVCTLIQGKPNGYWPESTYGKFVNQDRYFAGRVQLVREGEWWNHMPSIVLGVNDPTTGDRVDYTDMKVDGSGNGFFNRWYAAMTKHFDTPYGELGVHAAYLYNQRTDYPLNGPAFGVNFRPNFHRNLNIIAEYDAKTINVGATYALWNDHFNFLFELQEGKYISAGLVYKVNLLGGNKWKSKLFHYE